MNKLLLAFACATAAFCSQAAYLMWQIGTDTVAADTYLSENLNQADLAAGNYYAQVKVGTKDADLKSYTAVNRDDVETSWGLVGGTAATGDNRYQTVDLGTMTGDGYSYYIEIAKYVDGNYEGVARSQTMTYAELVNNNFVGTDLDIPNLATWQGAGPYTVPEPTSALMVMIGLACLGLKRRKL